MSSTSNSLGNMTSGNVSMATPPAPATVPSPSMAPTTSVASGSNDGGIMGYFSNMSWVSLLVIILVLAILGLNIFIYLAQGTQLLAETSKPVIGFLSYFFGDTLIDATKTTIDTSATGAKAGIDVTAGAVTTGLDVVQGAAKGVTGQENRQGSTKNASKFSEEDENEQQQEQANSLNQTLNQAKNETANNDNSGYQADDSYSSIQGSRGGGKAGWCYIGEERNVRSCIQVGADDQCMSGDIFPSQDICVNPSLRE